MNFLALTVSTLGYPVSVALIKDYVVFADKIVYTCVGRFCKTVFDTGFK